MVLIADGTARVRIDAVISVLDRLGGGWRGVGAIYSVLPRFVRDGMYRLVAKHRFKVRPPGGQTRACPVLPPQLAERFHT
jgi:predicted DCC family thiol-disulfide oxidoreductase YuxK